MGLDTVELIMAVEEEFDITIPDEVAGGIETAGDLCEVVVRIRRENPCTSTPENTDKIIWAKLKEIIVDQLGVDPGKVTKEAKFVEDLGAD